MQEIHLRDGISRIEQLKPVDSNGRYCYFQMRGIFETSLGFYTRGCEKELVKLGFNIPYDRDRDSELIYCDFWHYQLKAVFRNRIRNDSHNSIYVGTPNGIDYKKIKVIPNEWQKMMLERWNELFGHLTDEHGWIKIRMWW